MSAAMNVDGLEGNTDQAGFLRLLYQEASLRERPPGISPPSLNHVSALYALRQLLFFSSFLHKVITTTIMIAKLLSSS